MKTLQDILMNKATAFKVPITCSFELSPVCNFSCKMCYIRKTKAMLKASGKELIPAEKWMSLAKECIDAGMLYLLLTGGEPFMYPRFKELYISLHKQGILLMVNTNGSLITEETICWLKKYMPMRIQLTLYGASAETYEKVCGNGAMYHRVVEAIHLLKENDIPLLLNASIIPENKQDLKAIIDFGKNLDIPVRVATYMFPPIRREAEETDSRLSPQESGRLNILKKYYSQSQEEFIGNWEAISMGNASSASQHSDCMECRAGKCTTWISWEGKMTACGMMEFPMVEYPLETSFKECWKKISEKIPEIEVLKECHDCKYRGICMPCASVMLAETGDVNKKSEYYCEIAKASYQIYEEMVEKIKRGERIES